MKNSESAKAMENEQLDECRIRDELVSMFIACAMDVAEDPRIAVDSLIVAMGTAAAASDEYGPDMQDLISDRLAGACSVLCDELDESLSENDRRGCRLSKKYWSSGLVDTDENIRRTCAVVSELSSLAAGAADTAAEGDVWMTMAYLCDALAAVFMTRVYDGTEGDVEYLLDSVCGGLDAMTEDICGYDDDDVDEDEDVEDDYDPAYDEEDDEYELRIVLRPARGE